MESNNKDEELKKPGFPIEDPERFNEEYPKLTSKKTKMGKMVILQTPSTMDENVFKNTYFGKP